MVLAADTYPDGKLSTLNLRSETLVALIRLNKEAIGLGGSTSIVKIEIGPITKRNGSKSREGGPITIHTTENGQAREKRIWMKRVDSPKAAFTAWRFAYERLSALNLGYTIPKPHFFDERGSLIFVDRVNGTGARWLGLRYANVLNLFPTDGVPSLFYDIGVWLKNYHRAVATSEAQTLSPMIEGLIAQIEGSRHFDRAEQHTLVSSLSQILQDPVSSIRFPVVRPHNDFTLRNIMVDDDHSLRVLDWDAMSHEKFPRRALCWWDLCALLLNIQSLTRFRPIVRSNRIRAICDALCDGYFANNTVIGEISARDFMSKILYVFASNFYIGRDTDRPLYEIYRNRLGWRYAAALRTGLLASSADLTRDAGQPCVNEER